MANIIKHKRSAVSGAVPAADSLSAGELAINTADGKLFTRKADGTVIELTKATAIDGGEIAYDSLLNGLQAFWLFDNTVGHIPDVSDNNHPLFVAVSATAAEISVQNRGLTLDRANFLYAAHAFSTRRTVAFWLKIYDAPQTDKTILTFGPFGATSGVEYLALNDDRELRWYGSPHTNVTVVSTAIPLNAWTHVTLVRDAVSDAGTLKIYINGALQSSISAAPTNPPSNASDVVTFGSFDPAVRVSFDCAGIWNRAITPAEVAALFNGGGDAYSLPAVPAVPVDPAAFVNVFATAPITSLTASVAGSSGTLFPAFDPDIYDYGVLTNSTTLGSTATYTLTVNGTPTTDSSFVGKTIKVSFGETAYYIRLLPSDMPLGAVVTQPQEGYVPGYYITTSRRDINVGNYNIVYDERGVPVWYVQNAGTPHLAQHGNDRNKVGVSRNGTGQRYSMTITDDAIETKAFNFLPTVRNGNTYQYNFGNHEFLEITSPPSARGNVIYNTFVTQPAAGSPAITDKAYGVYIQEQTPQNTIGWEWWTSDRFDQTALARNASFFHMNSVDIHPVTGDMLLSCRQCSAIVCVDRATKDVKWVIQGASQPWGNIIQTANQYTLDNAKWLTLEDEPELEGYQYLGPEGQHHARWATNVNPLTPGNQVIAIFDNQAGFFPGSTNSPKTVSALTQTGTTVTGTAAAHGFTTGAYVQVVGANESVFNGIFSVTVVDANTFTYTVTESGSATATGTITATRALTYWPHSANSPAARGVIYEIDLTNNKAIHRASVFAPNGTSGYLGSYQIMRHDSGEYSHVLNFTQQHPPLVEYGDSGDGASPTEIIFAVDFPGDLYRITKVSKDYFDIDYLRATAGLPITVVS